MGNQAKLDVKGKKLSLTQSGDYTWNGNAAITIDENKAGEFALKLRIPGWARNLPVPGNLYSYVDKLITLSESMENQLNQNSTKGISQLIANGKRETVSN